MVNSRPRQEFEVDVQDDPLLLQQQINKRCSTSSSNSDLSFLDLSVPSLMTGFDNRSLSHGDQDASQVSEGDSSKHEKGTQEHLSDTNQTAARESCHDQSSCSTLLNDSTTTLKNVSFNSGSNFAIKDKNSSPLKVTPPESRSTSNLSNNGHVVNNALRSNHHLHHVIPLASDEDASSGSVTPPTSRRKNSFTPNLDVLQPNHLNSQGSLASNQSDVSFEQASSRKSWLFIDSPVSTANHINLNHALLNNNLHRTTQNSHNVEFDRRFSQPKLSNSRDGLNSARTSRLFDLRNSQPDPILHSVLDSSSSLSSQDSDQDSRLKNERQEGRHPAIMALYPLEEDASLIESRPVARPPREHQGHRIGVKCTQIKLDFEVEPIFVSMALYDVKERKKVSENFYFDMNTEAIKRMLSSHIPYQDISSLARSCIFSITYPTTDMYFVIKMEKVLQGDPSDSIDPYVSREEKAKAKIKTEAHNYCERLGKYRQPFAWTAFSLMDVLEGGKCQVLERDSGLNSFSNDCYHGSSETIDSEVDRRSSGSTGYETLKRLGDTLTRMGSLERTPRAENIRRSWTTDDLSHALDTFVPITITINSVFKQEYDKLKDEDLFKILPELKKNSSTYRKLKNINCSIKLDVAPVRDQPKYCLTPELAKVTPFPDEKGRPTKELLEFPLKEILKPHYVFRNLLFVYPKSLNFTNRPGSARNITCRVQIMSGEDDYSALNNIFGRSGCPEFASEIFTSVMYHNRSPDFMDEIKIKLPTKLIDQHHILFTFYHISCQKSKLKEDSKDNDRQETCLPLGWTWLPLYRDARLQTGTFNLPVMMEKPPPSYSFLTPYVNLPNTKWVDNHKDVFTVTVEAESSVHTQDQTLDNFLQLSTCIEEENIPIRYQNTIEHEFRKSILDIHESQMEYLVNFFPVIMNKLVRLLVRPPIVSGNILNTSQTVFESMALIVNKISKLSEEVKTSLLTTFSHYQCLFPHPDSFPVSQESDDRVMSPNASFHVRSNSNPNLKHFIAQMASSNNTSVTAKCATPGVLSRMASMRSPQSKNRCIKNSPANHQRSLDFSLVSDDDSLFSQNTSMNQSAVGSKVITNYWHPHRKLFHEELLLQWVVSSGNAREVSLTNPSFFFDLIIKSASENLAVTGLLTQSSRKDRFTHQFNDDVVTLVNSITAELVLRLNRDTKDMEFIQKLNSGLAFFLRDLLNLADRSFVFSLIRVYCKNIGQSGHSVSMTGSVVNQLYCLKIDFLRIVCSHEHYFALNLPFNSPLFPSSNPLTRKNSLGNKIHPATSSLLSSISFLDQIASFNELSHDYQRQHFLAGLVLSTLVSSLEVPSAVVQSKAVGLIRSLIGHHDWDIRCQDNKEVRSKLASLYLPLVNIVMDSLSQLHDFSEGSLIGETNQLMTRLGTLKRCDFKRRPVSRRNSLAEADVKNNGSKATTPVETDTTFTTGILEAPRKYPLREDTTKDLLLCFLWVVKNAPQDLVTQLWKELSIHRLGKLVDVLHLCIACFHYKGRKTVNNLGNNTLRKNSDLKLKLEDAIMGLGSARRELILRRRDRSSTQSFSSADFGGQVNLRWKKEAVKTGFTNMKGKTKEEMETELTLGGHLSTETNIVVLDVVDNLCSVVAESGDLNNSDHMKQVSNFMSTVLQLLIHQLSLNQSTLALKNIFSFQRNLLSKYPSLIFEERFDRELCSELCLQILKHCASCVTAVRSQASASLYLLMRQNYASNSSSNFAKIKMQVTMSLSSLVGLSHTLSENCLRRSLKTILVYAVIDKDFQETSFPQEVQELIFNLHMILSDTIRMKEYQEDPEMLLDLMYRIAKGYQNSPDLRLTWLLNMAQKHLERGNQTEAGHCFIHGAAMVAEYLHALDRKAYLPASCTVFQNISSNILEESATSSSLCTGKPFSEAGLLNLMERAAACFTAATLYEIVNEVYKLLIPVAEAKRDYKKLASIHGRLQDCFMKVEQQQGKRVFETYFRVGFYGNKFGDLDGEEFVYKEPYLTKLAEIASRLESFYFAQFGEDHVEVIKDSNPVDLSKLEHDKVYIQITYVEPYFDASEAEQRQTCFEMNYNIKRFLYSTPFTPDGKRAHGQLHEQYKRKTILTTANCFPYVKTRIQVVDRVLVTLTPIEVAIDDIQKKTNELASVTYQPHCDPKILQMVLQGCIGTTVNQGPLEIANVFLSSDGPAMTSSSPPTDLQQQKLRDCFITFCKRAGDALKKNKALIGQDQKDYQREMENNYDRFRKKLTPMLTKDPIMSSFRNTSGTRSDHSLNRTTNTRSNSTFI